MLPPLDCLCEIFSFIDFRSRFRLRLVSSEFLETFDESMWRYPIELGRDYYKIIFRLPQKYRIMICLLEQDKPISDQKLKIVKLSKNDINPDRIPDDVIRQIIHRSGKMLTIPDMPYTICCSNDALDVFARLYAKLEYLIKFSSIRVYADSDACGETRKCPPNKSSQKKQYVMMSAFSKSDRPTINNLELQIILEFGKIDGMRYVFAFVIMLSKHIDRIYKVPLYQFINSGSTLSFTKKHVGFGLRAPNFRELDRTMKKNQIVINGFNTRVFKRKFRFLTMFAPPVIRYPTRKSHPWELSRYIRMRNDGRISL